MKTGFEVMESELDALSTYWNCPPRRVNLMLDFRSVNLVGVLCKLHFNYCVSIRATLYNDATFLSNTCAYHYCIWVCRVISPRLDRWDESSHCFFGLSLSDVGQHTSPIHCPVICAGSTSTIRRRRCAFVLILHLRVVRTSGRVAVSGLTSGFRARRPLISNFKRPIPILYLEVSWGCACLWLPLTISPNVRPWSSVGHRFPGIS